MNVFKKISIATIWLWLGVFALAPLLMMVATSLLTSDSEKLAKLPLTLSNYGHLLNDVYLKIFLQSFSLAASATLLCLVLAYPFAYVIARSKSKYKTVLLLLVMIPFWTSSLIRTYAIMAILKAKGILNTLLLALGIIHQPLHILYSSTAVLIGCVYDLLPFMILPLYANMEKLDESLLEAARDLGASKLRTLVKIIIPLTLPGIIAGSILVFLPAMTMFYIPVLLGGAKNLLLGNLIENQFLIANNWPSGAAISVFITILMCIMVFIYWLRTNEEK
jgi:spermidine/putrescine transport system permease protein